MPELAELAPYQQQTTLACHGRACGHAVHLQHLALSGAAVAVAVAGLRRHRKAQRARRVAVVGVTATGATDVESATAIQTPPVWVVNLDKSVQRWKNCQEEFAKQGVKAERFPATLGKALTDEELKETCTRSARYFCTAGMVGCFMSHLNIWKKVAAEGPEAVVVLEDDVLLYPDFHGKLHTLLKELPEDWDVCLLGAVGCISPETEPIHMKLYDIITGGGRPSPGKTRMISPNVFVPFRPAGTHAYMVSRKGAEKLSRLCPKPRYHVDLTAWGLKELKLYAAKSFLATQRFDDDTTVSKQGAPLTKRFLRWCWDITGLSAMGKKAGVGNLTWAWTIACFALPIPFSSTRRRLIVEMGPSTSLMVLICLLCIPLKSFKPVGFGLLYMVSICCIIRLLAGTFKKTPMGLIALTGAAIVYFG